MDPPSLVGLTSSSQLLHMMLNRYCSILPIDNYTVVEIRRGAGAHSYIQKAGVPRVKTPPISVWIFCQILAENRETFKFAPCLNLETALPIFSNLNHVQTLLKSHKCHIL